MWREVLYRSFSCLDLVASISWHLKDVMLKHLELESFLR